MTPVKVDSDDLKTLIYYVNNHNPTPQILNAIQNLTKSLEQVHYQLNVTFNHAINKVKFVEFLKFIFPDTQHSQNTGIFHSRLNLLQRYQFVTYSLGIPKSILLFNTEEDMRHFQDKFKDYLEVIEHSFTKTSNHFTDLNNAYPYYSSVFYTPI